jgi:DNA polymerase elongation subunit (family B)
LSYFYTDVFTRGNKVYVRGYENGKAVKKVEEYSPYLFLPAKNGTYKTLDGQSVKKVSFDRITEAREFLKSNEDVDNMQVYGYNNWAYMYIYDNYKGDIDYDPKLIKVVSLDIECKSDAGFPDIQKADQALTAITMRLNGKNIVFGVKYFKNTDPDTIYVLCENEIDMVNKFLLTWNSEKYSPDIVTGWNIEFFDIPYLVNRIRNLGFDIKRMSPWGFVEEKSVEFRGKENQSYSLAGITIMDYYQLYRKFSFGNQESYKLDYIAQVELGEKKVDYRDQGYKDLTDLYEKNHQLFIEYNIQDTVLVDKLDEKMKFIEQVMAMAYDAKINFDDTMTTVRMWDTIIHNYLLDQDIVIPQFVKQNNNQSLVGGHVKEPKLGLSKWVVSFDLNSLYPHLIMQYNISPETFVDKVSFPSIDHLLNGTWEYRDGMVAYAANGCRYRKNKQGFLPALMEKMYNDRVVFKKKMLEAKKKYEETKNPNDEKLIARYHNMQLAKKIQLNSAYGALGNQYFRWFNFNHAESITTSGQLSIRWIEKKVNSFLNRILKTTEKDYVIAADTDSIYITLNDLVEKACQNKNEEEIVNILDQFIEAKIQPYLDESYQELADMMNAYQQKMKMKRETIANKGIWKAKKMYILNCWNVEGVQYDKPKLKIQGIEAVRSSTPHACREKLKKSFEIVMNENESDLCKFLDDFKKEFMTLPFEQVAFPRGVKNMKEYDGGKDIYRKGTPIHVKAALLYNHSVITNPKLYGKLPLIQDGDKIKFAYLKQPNPFHDSVVGAPDTLPVELGLDQYIDRETQFDKTFMEPLRSITEVIDWNIDRRATLEEFFG